MKEAREMVERVSELVRWGLGGGGRQPTAVIGKVVSSFVVITAFAFRSSVFVFFDQQKAKTTTANTNCLPLFFFLFFAQPHFGFAAKLRKNL